MIMSWAGILRTLTRTRTTATTTCFSRGLAHKSQPGKYWNAAWTRGGRTSATAAGAATAATKTALASSSFSTTTTASHKPQHHYNPLDPHNKATTFFDMIHSNNGARVRLWLRCSPDENVLDKEVELTMLTYADLQTTEYKAINPFQKIPSLILHTDAEQEEEEDDNICMYESSVILSYLEDKYHDNKIFVPQQSAELRQRMNLSIRLHDLYVASPNCTAAGFSHHSQGAMYLAPVPTATTPARRVMSDPSVRAAKIAELWKQLMLLEKQLQHNAQHFPNSSQLYIVGDQLSLADFTWWPTTIFMEFMLPKVFDWVNVFDPAQNNEQDPLPHVSRWWKNLRQHPEFALVRKEIWNFWQVAHDDKNHFDTIREVVDTRPDYQWSYPVNWEASTTRALVHYQKPPPANKHVGRYIQQPPKDDLVDEHDVRPVTVHNARLREEAASYHVEGFELCSNQNLPTAFATIDSFKDPKLVRDVYYEEIRTLVKSVTKCKMVGVFDHTLRTSADATTLSLNANDASQAAAPVHRVHSDYSELSAPKRLQQLAKAGTLLMSGSGESLTEDQVDDVLKLKSTSGKRRFAFVNVWRSIDQNNDILTNPLVVCDPQSLMMMANKHNDLLRYQMKFPQRTGENYALLYNPLHQWYMYPRMHHTECLVFAAYDSQHPTASATKTTTKTMQPNNNTTDKNKNDSDNDWLCVFHTSIVDPRGDYLNPPPPRQSIEVRTVAIW